MPPRKNKKPVSPVPDALSGENQDAPEEEEQDELEPTDPEDCDQDINDMIHSTLTQVPKAVLKFKVTDPTIVAKTLKAREAREKRAAAKKTRAGQKRKNATASVESVEVNTKEDRDETDSEMEGKVPKKRKKAETGTGDELSDEEDEIVAIELIFYVYIEKPPQPRTSKGKLTDSDKYVQKGPFKIKSTDTYASFLVNISRALPCPILNIIQDKMTWKCQTPQSSPPLPLGGITGYSAMIGTLKAKKAGSRTGIIMMPPPTRPPETPHWDTTNETKPPEKTFDYGALDVRSTEDSIAQQRLKFNTVVGPTVSELKDKYPVGNHPNFPGRRIYTDVSTGWTWELTEIRLNVWATHITRQQATLDHPPESTYFDKAARILPPKGTNIESSTPITPHALAAAHPSLVATQSQAPAMTPPEDSSRSTMSKLVDIMMLSMLQQQQAVMANMASPASLSSAVASQAASSASGQSTVPVLPLSHIPDVSLEEFCMHYHIDDKDKARLEKMEFRPGDRINDLGPEEWRDFGGFLTLSWSRIKTKNEEFLCDVQAGLWK